MEWIELPKAYSKNCLPVEKEEIATPDKIEQWEYLKPISEVTTQMDNIEVGMLIGANCMKCMKALEPMEIISSRNGEPHACKTKLGWCTIVSSPHPKIKGGGGRGRGAFEIWTKKVVIKKLLGDRVLVEKGGSPRKGGFPYSFNIFVTEKFYCY